MMDGDDDDNGDADAACRHNDLPWQYRQHVGNAVYESDALKMGWPAVHSDIPRMKTGHLGAQVRPCFTHLPGVTGLEGGTAWCPGKALLHTPPRGYRA